jgi:tRNA/rRNA methyltransferase
MLLSGFVLVGCGGGSDEAGGRGAGRVLNAEEVAGEIREEEAGCAILFGPEASGLDKEDLSHADGLLYFPVNPDFGSLNLAQAVLLFGWEWWRGMGEAVAPERRRQVPAPKEELEVFLDRLEGSLEDGRFFSSEEMKPGIVRSVRAMFQRMVPSDRELKMLHGVVTALSSKEAREGNRMKGE